MSDLVERLRKTAKMVMPHYPMDICTQAAARIEALEAALQRIRDDGKNCVDHCRRQAGQALARAALPPEQEK